jgi:phospholipid N-methyltransferase
MNYLAKLLTSGAIRETPKKVIECVADEIRFTEGIVIMEAGAGQGEITKAILDRKQDTGTFTYYAFEIDDEACQYLSETFPQITLVQQSIFDFEQFLPDGQQQLDYFVSSIPLSFYKREGIEAFLEKVKQHLKPGGKAIIVFTAAWLMPLFKKQFPNLTSQTFLSFPPYFMIVAEKE